MTINYMLNIKRVVSNSEESQPKLIETAANGAARASGGNQKIGRPLLRAAHV